MKSVATPSLGQPDCHRNTDSPTPPSHDIPDSHGTTAPGQQHTKLFVLMKSWIHTKGWHGQTSQVAYQTTTYHG